MIKSGFSGAGKEEFSGSLGPTDIVGLVVTHMLAHRFEPDDGVRIYAGYLKGGRETENGGDVSPGEKWQ